MDEGTGEPKKKRGKSKGGKGRRTGWEMQPHQWMLDRINKHRNAMGLKTVESLIEAVMKRGSHIGATSSASIYRIFKRKVSSAYPDVCKTLNIELPWPVHRRDWEEIFLKFFYVEPALAGKMMEDLRREADAAVTRYDRAHPTPIRGERTLMSVAEEPAQKRKHNSRKK